MSRGGALGGSGCGLKNGQRRIFAGTVIFETLALLALAVDLHKNLVEVPLSVERCMHLINAPVPHFRCKYWANFIPPISNRLMANIDAALV